MAVPTAEDWVREAREALAKKRRDEQVSRNAAAMEMPAAARGVRPPGAAPALALTDPRYPPFPAPPRPAEVAGEVASDVRNRPAPTPRLAQQPPPRVAALPDGLTPRHPAGVALPPGLEPAEDVRRRPAPPPPAPPMSTRDRVASVSGREAAETLRRLAPTPPPPRPGVTFETVLQPSERAAAVERMADPLQPEPGAPRGEDLPSERMLSVARSMGAGTTGVLSAGLKAVEYWGTQLDRLAGGLHLTPGATKAQQARQARAIIESAAAELFPEDPEHRKTFVNRVFQGVGSSLPFLALSIGTGGTMLPVAAAGALVESGATIEEAEQRGATEEQKLLAGTLALPVGGTEAFGVGSMPARIARMGTKSVPGVVAREALEEAGQEGVQTGLGNLVMRATGIDPRRPVGQDVLGSAIAAAAAGGLMGGGGVAVHQATTPWGRVMSAQPNTAEQAADLEAKVAAGQPLTQEEAATVQKAQARARELAMAPTDTTPLDTIGDLAVAEQAAQAEAAAAKAKPEPRLPTQAPPPGPNELDIYDLLSEDPKETTEFFQHVDGSWDPQREAGFHQRWLDHVMENAIPNDPNRTMYFVGGGPAAGKSALTGGMDLTGKVHIDADDAKRSSPEWHRYRQEHQATGREHTTMSAQVHRESVYLSQRAIAEALNARASFVYENTGADIARTIDIIDRALERGYRVQIGYIDAPMAKVWSNALHRYNRPDGDRRMVPWSATFGIHRTVAQTYRGLVERYRDDPRVDLKLYSTANRQFGQEPELVDDKGRVVNEELWREFAAKSTMDTGQELARHAAADPEGARIGGYESVPGPAAAEAAPAAAPGAAEPVPAERLDRVRQPAPEVPPAAPAAGRSPAEVEPAPGPAAGPSNQEVIDEILRVADLPPERLTVAQIDYARKLARHLDAQEGVVDAMPDAQHNLIRGLAGGEVEAHRPEARGTINAYQKNKKARQAKVQDAEPTAAAVPSAALPARQPGQSFRQYVEAAGVKWPILTGHPRYREILAAFQKPAETAPPETTPGTVPEQPSAPTPEAAPSGAPPPSSFKIGDRVRLKPNESTHVISRSGFLEEEYGPSLLSPKEKRKPGAHRHFRMRLDDGSTYTVSDRNIDLDTEPAPKGYAPVTWEKQPRGSERAEINGYQVDVWQSGPDTWRYTVLDPSTGKYIAGDTSVSHGGAVGHAIRSAREGMPHFLMNDRVEVVDGPHTGAKGVVEKVRTHKGVENGTYNVRMDNGGVTVFKGNELAPGGNRPPGSEPPSTALAPASVEPEVIAPGLGEKLDLANNPPTSFTPQQLAGYSLDELMELSDFYSNEEILAQEDVDKILAAIDREAQRRGMSQEQWHEWQRKRSQEQIEEGNAALQEALKNPERAQEIIASINREETTDAIHGAKEKVEVARRVGRLAPGGKAGKVIDVTPAAGYLPPAAENAQAAEAAADTKRKQTEIDAELAEAMAPATTMPVPRHDYKIAANSPQDKVLMAIWDLNMRGGPKVPSDVKKIAEKAGITLDQAYDALESNLNMSLRDLRWMWGGNAPSTEKRIATMAEMENTVVTRAVSLETRDKQQFSTPLPLSEGMAIAAGVRAGEVVMEPSAGTGNLIEPFVARPDVRLWVNEFDPSRVEVLRGAGYPEAHEGDFFRPLGISPQVVVSNPPWGSLVTGTGKKKYRHGPITMPVKQTDIAQGHMVHALRALAAGGRGVFLVGENYFNDSQAPFRKWLAENYALRATVTSPPGAYKRRGTDYGSVMLVVDKVAPMGATEHLKPKDWNEFAAAMDRLSTGDLARPSQEALTKSGQPRTINVEAPNRVPGEPPAPPSPDERRDRPARGSRGRSAGGVRGKSPRFADDPGGAGAGVVPAPEPEGGTAGPDDTETTVPSGVRPTVTVDDLRAQRERDIDEARRSDIFAPYGVRGKWAGSLHPRLVVTTASLASTKPPDLQYRPHADVLQLNQREFISDENMDAVAMAGQNNSARKGLVVADAPGFGKSRQVTGMALDAVKTKWPRMLVITASQTNVSDLIDTMNEAGKEGGIELPPLVRMTDYKIKGKAAQEAEEIPVHERGVYYMDAENFNKYREKIIEIGFDGIIADEADKFLNLESKRGAAWDLVHRDIFRRREDPYFVYLSGSVGTSVENLEYLHGLRAWPMGLFGNWLGLISGRTTSIETNKKEYTPQELEDLKLKAKAGDDDAQAELDAHSGKGAVATTRDKKKAARFGGGDSDAWEALLTPAATEQVVRELSDDGLYLSRDLWRHGVEFEMPEMKPPKEKLAALNRRIKLMRAIEFAFLKFGRQNKGDDKILTIRGALQFHYKRALFDLNLDNLINLTKKEGAGGHQVVLSLINVSGTKDEEGEGNLFGAIKAINTQRISKKDGELINEGKIPAALEARAHLLDRMREEAPALRDPLKTIEKALGKGKVVFITGKQTAKEKKAAIERFQTGQAQYIVISGAGKRGINLHHTHIAEHFGHAAGRRALIIADTQWDAPGTLQELGRVDRASQISAPRILIPHLGLSSQRKFLGTIANRMAQIGATSRGQEGATGAEGLSEFTMGGRLDAFAWRKAYYEMPDELKVAFTKKVFKEPYSGGRGEDYDPENERPASNPGSSAKFNDFMLDLQLMPVEVADEAMAAFFKAKDDILNKSAEARKYVAQSAMRARGNVLEKADLSRGLTLYRVKTEGTKNPKTDKVENRQEYGILTGKIATTGQVGRAVNAMRHTVEDRTADAGFNFGVTHARYLSLQDLETGRWISGMEVPYSYIDSVATAFGAKMERRQTTRDTLQADLNLGAKVAVRGPDGKVWTLRRRQDGRTAIDGAKMADKAALLPSGLPPRAAYEPVGNTWWVPDEALDRFLDAFPIVQAEPEPAKKAKNVGVPTSEVPRGTVPTGTGVRSVPEAEAPAGPAVVSAVQERPRGEAQGGPPRPAQEGAGRPVSGVPSAGGGGGRGPAAVSLREAERELKSAETAHRAMTVAVQIARDSGRNDIIEQANREMKAASDRLAKAQAAVPAIRSQKDSESELKAAEAAYKTAREGTDFAYDTGRKDNIERAEAEARAALDRLRVASAAARQAIQEPPAGGGLAGIRARIDYLRQKVKDVVLVGQTHAIPEIEAEIRDLQAQAARLESNGALPKAPAAIAVGKTDDILTPQGKVTVRYEVVHLNDLIPSHDPRTFRQNPGYPEGVQNRPYHSDKSEQAKVIRQAQTFEPRFVLGTVPDAINGAPILAPNSNVVLGGNSRAMTMARAIDTIRWKDYIDSLVAGASLYGFDTTDLAQAYGGGAKDMVLVRRVVPDRTTLAGEKVDRDTMRLLARAFNQPMTQALNLEADAVSRGMAVSEETQALIAQALEGTDDGSLADVLRDQKVVRDLIPRLLEDGVFTRQDLGAYMTKDGALNEMGRKVVELTMLGSVIRDSDLLATAPKDLLNRVARALPAVTRLRGKEGWDIADRLRDALIVAKGAKASGMSVGEFVSQHSLFAGEGPTRDVALLAARLVHDRPKRFAQRMMLYASEGKSDPRQRNLGLTQAYSPEDSFEAHFGGIDGMELAGQEVPEHLRSQAGFVRPGALGVPQPGPASRLAGALWGWVRPRGGQRAAAAPQQTGGALPAEPHATGEYAAWIREVGPQRGKAAYTAIRRHQNARALLLRYLREDTRAWFGALSAKQQAKLFETAKGLRTDPTTGTMLFGGLQPAGILEIRGRKDRRAVGHGVDMPLNQALAGGLLPNGLLIGEPLYDHHAIQLYQIIPEADARRRYAETVQTVPRAAEILADFRAIEEEVKTDPMFGFRLPPRSAEVARREYNIETRRADEVGYVPSVLKEPRTFVGKIRRALHDARSGHRLVKTGEAAEKGLEIKHLAKATEQVRASLIEEEVRHSLAVTLMPLVLEERGSGPLPQGYVEFNRGVLKDPQKVIAWATRNRKRLEDQGVDVKSFISAAAQAGGKRYMMPAYAAERLGELIAPKKDSADQKLHALQTAAHDFGSAAVNFIAANYLIRPSTTVRNFIGNALNMNAMRLRDAYVGIIQHVIPAARFQELPMAQFVADIVAPLSALTRGSREALPAEALGKIMGAELGYTNLPGLALRFNGFNADDIWTRRTIYEAVARARAANIYAGLKKAGQPVPPFRQFYRDYRAQLPEEVENLAWRTNDMFGSFNYENVPRLIEKMKRGPISRAALLYPTYYYKLLSGPYRELYGPQNIANLFGPGRSKEQRVTALANMLTGATIFALLWSIIPNPWDEYPEGLKDSDLPTEYQTTGRLKVPLLKSETGESYWVRALDMPFIGDVMAMKAMGAGHLALSTYLNERLSAGPLALLLMWMFDYQGRFDRYQPLSNRLGRQAVSFLPLSPLWMYLRRTTDTYRRRAALRSSAWMPDTVKDSIQGDPAWESFVAGIMDSLPGLSRQLEVAHANVRPHNPLRYPPAGEHLKFWLLNVKPMREQERRTAIHEAERRKREREEKGLASSWGR